LFNNDQSQSVNGHEDISVTYTLLLNGNIREGKIRVVTKRGNRKVEGRQKERKTRSEIEKELGGPKHDFVRNIYIKYMNLTTVVFPKPE
jgi:hypothetical protein